ncbi:hypothetical protein RKD37_000366 [Streptomyces ambofaciens]
MTAQRFAAGMRTSAVVFTGTVTSSVIGPAFVSHALRTAPYGVSWRKSTWSMPSPGSGSISTFR